MSIVEKLDDYIRTTGQRVFIEAEGKKTTEKLWLGYQLSFESAKHVE